jgi:hypothetical protein
MVRSSFVAPETAASRHERAVNFRKLSKISFARPIECEFWKVLSRARPPPQKVWDTLVVSRTFKNLRSRGNPVLVVPQVLKRPRFEVGRRRRVWTV